MNVKLLKLLGKNARYNLSDLATMLGIDEQTVKNEISEMERAGLIRGYKTVIDWEKLDTAAVSALIELKVSPQADYGFEEIAKRVMMYEEVESVYLMSGGYDLCVMVRGKTFQQVAMFVAKELSTIDPEPDYVPEMPEYLRSQQMPPELSGASNGQVPV